MNNLTLATPRSEVEQAILKETDPQQLKSIVGIFNANLQKQEVIRAGKLSDLQDKLLEQLMQRMDRHPDNMSLKDITDTFKVLADAQSKQKVAQTEELPQIQINTQVNVGTELDRDSRQRVLDAVNAIMKGNVVEND